MRKISDFTDAERITTPPRLRASVVTS